MIPHVDGYIAYLTLLNERDGGINGVKLIWEECETVYDVTRTVECYERLKARGPTGQRPCIHSGCPVRLCGAASASAATGAGPEGDLAAGEGGPARLGHPAQHRRYDPDGPEGSGPRRRPP